MNILISLPRLFNNAKQLPLLRCNFRCVFCSTSSSTTTTLSSDNPRQEILNLAYDLHIETFKKKEDKVEKTNPLVIVHGLFGHKQNWRSVAKALQRELDNYVFVVDMRNHGESPHNPNCTYPAMAADLREFIRREVLPKSRFKQVFLLGHSMGGKVAAECAMKEDQSSSPLLEKLIIEDIAPHLKTDNPSKTIDYIRAMRELDMSRTRTQLDYNLKLTIAEKEIREFLLTNLYKPRGGPFHWRCNLDAIESNAEHLLGHIVEAPPDKKPQCPTLFVAGKKSEYLKIERDNLALQKLFPFANFMEIRGAGHWVHAERPAQFIRCVIDFLKSGYFTYEQ